VKLLLTALTADRGATVDIAGRVLNHLVEAGLASDPALANHIAECALNYIRRDAPSSDHRAIFAALAVVAIERVDPPLRRCVYDAAADLGYSLIGWDQSVSGGR
jgi:hypothetical protein